MILQSLISMFAEALESESQALHPLKLSSVMDDTTLEQMRTVKLTSGLSFISFQVLAVARYAGKLPKLILPVTLTPDGHTQ
jgi:hypothetical protein